MIDPIFQISWANDLEKEWIRRQLTVMQRQTMNIRLMKRAKFALLRDANEEPIGWGGLDTEHQIHYPELFSLYLKPEFRHYSLGILLELTRASYLLSQGISRAYVRMTDDEAGAGLLQKRLQTGLYRLQDPSELAEDYVQLCKHCELYQKECRKRVFLDFDVEAFFKQSVKEIGAVADSLPKRFRLIRVAAQQAKASGEQHETTPIWKSYRPLWLDT